MDREYKYGDEVIIETGFYRGNEGTLIKYIDRQFGCYQIKLKNGVIIEEVEDRFRLTKTNN